MGVVGPVGPALDDLLVVGVDGRLTDGREPLRNRNKRQRPHVMLLGEQARTKSLVSSVQRICDQSVLASQLESQPECPVACSR